MEDAIQTIKPKTLRAGHIMGNKIGRGISALPLSRLIESHRPIVVRRRINVAVGQVMSRRFRFARIRTLSGIGEHYEVA